jgi:hypothetical protein
MRKRKSSGVSDVTALPQSFCYRALLIVLLASFCPSVNGQDQPIQVHRSIGGMRFEMDTLTLTQRQVSQLLAINPAASDEFAQARRLNAISGVMGFSGAVLLAIPVFSAILGGAPEWGLAAGGAGLLIGSIPLSMGYRRKATHAIDTYNSALGQTRLYFTGAGLTVKF